jgi:hypothetical protein
VGATGKIAWGDNEGAVERAVLEPPEGLKKEQKLSEAELARCFTVALAGKRLALMAPTPREKETWVMGINAVVCGLLGTTPGREAVDMH